MLTATAPRQDYAEERRKQSEKKVGVMETVVEVAEMRAREADLGLRALVDEIHILRSANKVLQVEPPHPPNPRRRWRAPAVLQGFDLDPCVNHQGSYNRLLAEHLKIHPEHSTTVKPKCVWCDSRCDPVRSLPHHGPAPSRTRPRTRADPRVRLPGGVVGGDDRRHGAAAAPGQCQ